MSEHSELKREVPVNDSRRHLLELFRCNNGTLEKHNDSVTKKLTQKVRIMTYNVHMWQGLTDQKKQWTDQTHSYINNFTAIFKTIQDLDPDILCLQEVMFISEIMKPLTDKYKIVSSCVINPSDYINKVYMTMILVKK